MLGAMNNAKIRTKILGVIGLCVAAMIGISGFAIYQMNKIGQELVALAEENMPLTRMVTDITAH